MLKKVNFKILNVVLVLLLVLETVLGVFLYLKLKNTPTYNSELTSYLTNNYSQDPTQILDTDKYDVFFTGETHSTKKNFEVMMKMIKSLSEKTNLKYLLVEDSTSNSILINDYLQSGDISKLNMVFKNFKGTFANNKELYQYYQDLYEFNKSLPSDKKLTYIGIDIEHQPSVAVNYLESLFTGKTIPEKVNEFFNYWYNSDDGITEAKTLLEQAYKDIEDFPQNYETILGNDFWHFKFVLKNLLTTAECELFRSDNLKWSTIRENAMISNFYEVYNHYPKGKFYGQWGMEHASLSTFKDNFYKENDPRLAATLYRSTDSPVKGRVCSMGILYLNSLSMNRDDANKPDSINEPSNKNNVIDSLKVFDKSNINFFKLDSENSPFSKDLYFMDKSVKGVTTDYSQYAVLVNDSGPCTMLD